MSRDIVLATSGCVFYEEKMRFLRNVLAFLFIGCLVLNKKRLINDLMLKKLDPVSQASCWKGDVLTLNVYNRMWKTGTCPLQHG